MVQHTVLYLHSTSHHGFVDFIEDYIIDKHNLSFLFMNITMEKACVCFLKCFISKYYSYIPKVVE